MNPQTIAALHAPVADYTWELAATLQNDTQDSGGVPVSWSRPVEIIGFLPTVTPVYPLAGGLEIPSPDDVEVFIDANQELRFTNRLGLDVSGPGASFVSLSALSVLAPRLHRIRLPQGAPDMNVRFRWKHDPTDPAAPFFESADVRLAFFARYPTPDEVKEWRGQR